MNSLPYDPRLTKAESTGTRTTHGFWDGHDERGQHIGGYGPIELPEYDVCSEATELADARKAATLGLGEAAKRLGLKPIELSGLEHGRYVPKDPALWAYLVAILESGCNCNPAERTGGEHDPKCPAFEVECTCYEMTGGHQPMCPYGAMLAGKKAGRRG